MGAVAAAMLTALLAVVSAPRVAAAPATSPTPTFQTLPVVVATPSAAPVQGGTVPPLRATPAPSPASAPAGGPKPHAVTLSRSTVALIVAAVLAATVGAMAALQIRHRPPL